jgi:hypothetical protein
MLYPLMEPAGDAAFGRNEQVINKQRCLGIKPMNGIGVHEFFSLLDSSTLVGKPSHNKKEQVVDSPNQAERDNKTEKHNKGWAFNQYKESSTKKTQ